MFYENFEFYENFIYVFCEFSDFFCVCWFFRTNKRLLKLYLFLLRLHSTFPRVFFLHTQNGYATAAFRTMVVTFWSSDQWRTFPVVRRYTYAWHCYQSTDLRTIAQSQQYYICNPITSNCNQHQLTVYRYIHQILPDV